MSGEEEVQCSKVHRPHVSRKMVPGVLLMTQETSMAQPHFLSCLTSHQSPLHLFQSGLPALLSVLPTHWPYPRAFESRLPLLGNSSKVGPFSVQVSAQIGLLREVFGGHSWKELCSASPQSHSKSYCPVVSSKQ